MPSEKPSLKGGSAGSHPLRQTGEQSTYNICLSFQNLAGKGGTFPLMLGGFLQTAVKMALPIVVL